MEKKNPYKFTIGFKKQISSHQRAAEILNQTSDKADLIAAAILSYMGESNLHSKDMDMDSLRPWIQGLIRNEVKNLMDHHVGLQGMEPEMVPDPMPQQTTKEEITMDLSEPVEESEDDSLALDFVNIMNSFRRP